MKLISITIVSTLLFISCVNTENKEKNIHGNDMNIDVQKPLKLTLEQANKLIELPLTCVQQDYPTKISHTLNSKNDVKVHTEMYPAFCGCFDWHSAVHGHWSMVKLLKEFPGLDKADLVKATLLNNISKQNIIVETNYFKEEKNKSFERTYGWAWLLKLAEELHTWDSPLAREL